MQTPDITPLVTLMKERHSIYLKRQRGLPKPWTDDKILQTYSFCNTYRELDRVTIWVRENIREPFADHPALWFALCMARQINWPDTLAELLADKKGATPMHGKRFDPDRMRSIMLARQARGEKLYTGAYMINAQFGKREEYAGRDKAFFTSHIVLAPLWATRDYVEGHLRELPTIEDTTNLLSTYHGWGGFMSYEVATDMRWTRYLNQAADICTWANPGPGAKRGLNRLYGRDTRAHLNRDKAIEEMREVYALVKKQWPRPSKDWPAIEMREIEHSLCECDKYLRVQSGEGRPRAKYQGV